MKNSNRVKSRVAAFCSMAHKRVAAFCSPFVLLCLSTAAYAAQSPQTEAAIPEGLGSISGIVLDISGAFVAGAEMSLTDANGTEKRAMNAGENGEFTFSKLPPGAYFVLAKATGLEPFKSPEITVTAQQTFQMPRIIMAVATARTEVVVRGNVNTVALAEQEIKAAERQRLFGLIPNYYTSYLYDAAPMNRKQKFSLAFHDTFDPLRVVGGGYVAAIEQARNSYKGYGQGSVGYGKRFAATYADGFTSDILSHAIFPALLHQDPRYFYQGTGSFKSRLFHAISFAVAARNDNGHLMPNYAYLFGDIGSGALSNLYYPHADRGVGLIFTNAAIAIGGRAGGSIVREFLSKRVTKNAHGNGKP